MKLYRYSPIESKSQLLEAIEYIHAASYKLCKNTFDRYLPNAGNVGVFTHYDDEYGTLVGIRNLMVEPSDDPGQKYFTLTEPITIAATENAPEATYTHLYIRKPDIYRAQVGDIDFKLGQTEYDQLKQSIQNGEQLPGARLFPRKDLDMIELYNPDIDVLAYVSTSDMSEKVHIKLSDETNL